MIILDTALEKRETEGNPIRVALVGAGFMGRGAALQIIRYTRGMRLVAISNRRGEMAKRAYEEAGVSDAHFVSNVSELEKNIHRDHYSYTDDAMLLCRAGNVDIVLEITGSVEFGARVALEAIAHKKHFLQMNAELDGTLGPVLKKYADKAGVIYSFTDGDQPGVQMNLYRFVKGIGLKPVLCGNIKGLHDPHRNPVTQESFAKMWGQKPHMVTSFADGTKISFEQAIVANATGMTIARRGMLGPTVPKPGMALRDAISLFDLEKQNLEPGLVDYLVGAEPAPGIFVIGTQDDARQKHYLNLYKLGQGPFYLFYTPYHLCHFEIPNSIARAVIFNDAVLAPKDAVRVEVVATAKVDLSLGQTLDAMGYFMTYGQAETAKIVLRDRLLPIGVAEGCVLNRDVAKDEVLTYLDVELPKGRVCDRLRKEQEAIV